MSDGEKPTSEDRPVWSLSRDEQRILAITFIGGLSSIIIGAGVIGALIALGGWVEHRNLHWLTQGGGLSASLILTALGALGGLVKDSPLYARLLGWIAAAVGIIILLVIIGIGAGIH